MLSQRSAHGGENLGSDSAPRTPPDVDDRRYVVGEDGIPLSPLDRRSDDEIERTRQWQYKRELQEALERWQGRDLTAFTDVARLCWLRERRPSLRWLADESEKLVERAMGDDEKKARRQWKAHRTRWEAVVELLERQDALFRTGKAGLSRAREILKTTTDAHKRARIVELLPELVEAARDDRGKNLELARAAVSKALEATDASGEPRTVKASYDLVEAAGGEQATFESYQELLRRRANKGD